MMHAESHRIPVIMLWDQLLIPIQGDVSDAQADVLCQDALEVIRRQGAEGMVLELSGVNLLDSHLCATLARLAAAAQLMGTRSVISGLKPDIAMTLQAMGISFGQVHTTLDLEDAFAWLGVRVSRTSVGAQAATSVTEPPTPMAVGAGGGT